MNIHQFLGLQATHNPHRWVLPVERQLCTLGGFLFGGAGLAAAVAALESTCARPLVWATAQYLSFARPPAIVDIDVTIPVAGRNTTQARAIGHVLDSEIFTVNGALGSRPWPVEAEWPVPPEVPPPADCGPIPDRDVTTESIGSRLDLRVASGRYGAARDGTLSADGRSALWVRMPEVEMSAAALAIIADWVPSGVGQALGRLLYVSSLDNTLRVVDVRPTEWVLCDIRMQAVHNGYAHGAMLLWSQEGSLLASASQSMVVRRR
jgi:acyl-CoA thioesterase II